MRNRLTYLLTIGAGAVVLSAGPAFAQAQKLSGIVVTNQNGQITIKTPQGDQTIIVPPGTSVESISGAFGGQKEDVPVTALIPGLPITANVENSGGEPGRSFVFPQPERDSRQTQDGSAQARRQNR
jgi:hypothetical protein